MSQNLGYLRTLVWSWLDDPNGEYFTQAEVDVWINNGQRELQKRLIDKGENYYVQRLLGTMVIGQDTYTLPTDFKKNHKLEVVLSGVSPNQVRQTLTPVTLIQLDAVSMTSGKPTAVCFKRNAMIVRPIPDQAYQMYLNQSYQVVDMVNSADLPDVPADYSEFIAVLATLDGFMKDQREPSEFVKQKLERYEQMLTLDSQRRDVSSPRMVVMTDGDGYGQLV